MSLMCPMIGCRWPAVFEVSYRFEGEARTRKVCAYCAAKCYPRASRRELTAAERETPAEKK